MLKKTLFVLTLASVFSAIGMSASQLAKRPTSFAACGDPCIKTTACASPCRCYIPTVGGASGICQPEGPPPTDPGN